jgi:chemotaxis protein CheC
MKTVSMPVLDGIRELVNIGIGKSAGSLNALTGHHVTLHVPDIHISTIHDLKEQIPHPDPSFSVVSLNYNGAFEGTAVLMFPLKSAENLFFLLNGETERTQENDELWRMTLLEIGNIIINAVMGSITNILGKKLEFQIPQYREDSLDHLLDNGQFADSQSAIVVHARFSVEDEGILGEIVLLLADQSIDILAELINQKIGISKE